MAKLINQSQAIRVGATSPKPVYTRILALRQDNIVKGDCRFQLTDSVAQNVWLYRVRVFVSHREPAGDYGIELRAITGTVIPKTYWEAIKLDMIIPVKWTPTPSSFYVIRKEQDLDWQLCQHFTDKPRFFGITIRNWFDPVCYVMADFLISEG